MTEEEVPVNPCLRAEQLLPEYWQGELNAGLRAWLEQHLETCAGCADLATFWRKLGQLPEAKPDPLGRRRFNAMLAAYPSGRPSHPWLGTQGLKAWAAAAHTSLAPWPLALAVVLLLAGFGGGWWLRGIRSPAAQGQSGEIASRQISALEEEVHAASQLVVLSMLQEQSANDRLEGVSYSRHLGAAGPEIVQALLHSLEYDPSPDVRLAALDALENAGAGPAVARGLVAAFEHQSSPLVEVALVDSLLELRPPTAQALLRKISTDPTYSPDVRQRASWGLSQWKQNPS